MPPAISDSELVERAKRGERAALETLAERYYSSVYAVALAQLRDLDAANDLAQEVFLRATLNLEALRDGSRYCAWLIRMTRNLGRDWQRRGTTRSRLLPLIPLDDEVSATVQSDDPNPRERMIQDDDNRELHDAIWRLPERQREIVLMHYQEGLDQKTIAERLGVHPSTVSRQLEKSMTQLRTDMDMRMRAALAPKRATPRMKTRAAAVAVVAATLSTDAKAAVLAAASKGAAAGSATESVSTGLGIWGFLQSLGAKCAAGITTMGFGKGVAVATVAAAVTGGTVYYASNQDPYFNVPPGMAPEDVPRTADEFLELISGEVVTEKVEFGTPKKVFIPFGTAVVLDFEPELHPLGLDDLYIYAPGPDEPIPHFAVVGNGDVGFGRVKMDKDVLSFIDFPGDFGQIDYVTFSKESDGIGFVYTEMMSDKLADVQQMVVERYQLGEISKTDVVKEILKTLRSENLIPTDPQDAKRFEKALRDEIGDFLINAQP